MIKIRNYDKIYEDSNGGIYRNMPSLFGRKCKVAIKGEENGSVSADIK